MEEEAISQQRKRCQLLFCLMKNPLLYRSARPESGRGRDARGTLWSRSLEIQSDWVRRLAWQAVFGGQIVWNRSTQIADGR